MLSAANPFSRPSALPYGLPEYENITLAHLEEALRAGMRAQRREWEQIASNPEPATVSNTLTALDESGDLLSRSASVFWTLASSVGGPELDRLQEELVPLFSQHHDAYQLDERIYHRLQELRKAGDLDEETTWTIEQEIRDFEREGVALQGEEKLRLQDLNMQISTLETAIEQRIAKQLDVAGLTVKEEGALSGLDPESKNAYRSGTGWFIPCRNFSTQPDQARLTSPAVRRALLDQSVSRGGGGNTETDTRGRIVELAHLRAERAALLGFNDHASFVMDSETVPNPQAVDALLTEVGAAARARVADDAKKLRELAASDPTGDGLWAADWPYYENQLRAVELGFDSEQLRPYLELDRVLTQGVFWAAKQLYGIDFVSRPDLVGWHPDVRVWEVLDSDAGPVGLFLGDFYKRPGKAGGAWMAEVQTPGGPEGRAPIISNDTNFQKPAHGQPLLLSWDDVETLFHEFGHALHGLFSDTRYQQNAGTSVPRDFVELPSQLNEMWAFHPRVLARYARHHETGEALPSEMSESLIASKTFGQGFATSEYVQAALIDQAWHRGTAAAFPVDPGAVQEFEENALRMIDQWEELVPPRYRSGYFAHSFAGGYDGAYYAYMWAEMLAAELEGWLRGPASASGDGGLNRAAGDRLRKELLSRGNSRDPMDSFRAVAGREPSAKSVLGRRGL